MKTHQLAQRLSLGLVAAALLGATGCDSGGNGDDTGTTDGGGTGTHAGTSTSDPSTSDPSGATSSSTDPGGTMTTGDESGDTGMVTTGGPGTSAAYPPGSEPFGHTYDEWGALWWEWAAAIPAATNPIVGGDCTQNQAGDVWFLAGNQGGTDMRTCTIPSDKAILFPVLNALCYPCAELDGTDACDLLDEPTLLTCLDGLFDGATLAVELDGDAIEDVGDYLTDGSLGMLDYDNVEPSLFFFPADAFGPGVPAADAECAAPWAEGNVCEAPAGPKSTSAAGIYVMLEALSPGTHSLHFYGALGPAEAPDFALDVTYELTVE
jgi:hypothetical protein